MIPRGATWVFLVVLLCLAPVARAAETDANPWYFEGSVGAGTSVVNHVGRSESGLAWSVGVMPAYAVSSRFAFGLGFDLVALPKIAGDSGGEFRSAELFAFSAVGVFRPTRADFECALALGAEGGTFRTSTGSDVVRSTPVTEQTARVKAGIGRAGLRLGYVSPGGFGLALSGSLAALGNSSDRIVPIVFLAQGTYSSR